MSGEWALILFTLLVQTAVGAYIFAGLTQLKLKHKLEKEKLHAVLSPVYYGVGILIALGMVASITHLGTPTNAPNAILNLGSSWLSREIMFLGVFAACWLISLLEVRSKKQVSMPMGLLTALAGLITVYAIATVYTSTLIVAWQHLNTYVAFYGTTFILGTLTGAAIIFSRLKSMAHDNDNAQEIFEQLFQCCSTIVLVAVVVQVTVAIIYGMWLGSGDVPARASAQILYNDYLVVMGMRWLLLLTGVILTIPAIWRKYSMEKSQFNLKAMPVQLLMGALTVVLLGEILGRYLFYISGVPYVIG